MADEAAGTEGNGAVATSDAPHAPPAPAPAAKGTIKVVIKTTGEGQAAVGGAKVEIRSSKRVEQTLTTNKDGTVTSKELPPGAYTAVQTGVPIEFLLPPEADRSKPVTIPDGGGEIKVDFADPPAGAIEISVVEPGAAPEKFLAGAILSVTGPDVSRTGLITGTAPLPVRGLAPGEYTVKEVTPPPNYGLNEPTELKIQITSEDREPKPANFENRLLTAQRDTAYRWPFKASVGALLALGVFALVAGLQEHWAQLFATGILAAGVLTLTVLGGRSTGVFRPIVGGDGRASTSLTQALLWTLLLVWTMAYLLGETLWGKMDLAKILPDNRWDDYLVILGAPFAAAVIAKGSVKLKMDSGTLQRSETTEGLKLGDLFKDDAKQTDLVDSQYLLFNFVAMGWFVASLVNHVLLPELPPALLAVTGTAAAMYSANKAVATNKPVITGVSPAAARSGDQITVTGLNFRPKGVADNDRVKVSIEGYGNVNLTSQTDTVLTAVIPPGCPTGLHNLVVTTAAGVDTEPSPLQLDQDAAQVLSVDGGYVSADATLTVRGRRFRSPFEPNASTATVWFGTTPVLGSITSPEGADVDTIVVDAPTTLQPASTTIAVKSTAGVLGSPVTVPVVV